ncbi:MAG: hypothetical protein R3D03_01415 [Geminicoccaceae bacterium]
MSSVTPSAAAHDPGPGHPEANQAIEAALAEASPRESSASKPARQS